MEFLTSFQPPDELEMLGRGFEIGEAHDPEECVLAYRRTYSDGLTLTVVFDVGHSSSIWVSIMRDGRCLSEMVAEGVLSMQFQSWHDDRILRIRFDESFPGNDLRIHHHPAPSIHFVSRRQFARQA
jgi:hypothetical protein